MKTTTTSHRRIGARTAKTSRISGNGNGRAPARRQTPAVSSRIASWLAKPKQNLIGGKWVPAASHKTFDVFNPAEGSVIARVAESDKEDINRAVASARRAFESGQWRRFTPSERGKLIWRIGDLILQHAALQQTISRAHYGCTSGSVSRRLGFGENRGYLPTANPPSSGSCRTTADR